MSGLGLPDHLAAALRSSDHRFIVTGASGWIGSATLHMLKGALGPDSFRHRVYAFAGSKRTLRLTDGTEVPLFKLDALDELRAGPCLLFHYAFLGKERVAAMSLADYVAANARITEIVRRAVARLQPAGMFLTSSGAVYRVGRSIETDLGTNPYGVLKYRDETVFAEACADTGTKLVTSRVFNLSGEYVNKVSSYAISSFILDALAGRPIVVRATRRVERSYVHVGDVVTLAAACLLSREPAPVAFDTAGERIVEMGELAERVGELLSRPIVRLQFDKNEPADRYVGDGETWAALCERARLRPFSLAKQVTLTAAFLAVTAQGDARTATA